MQIINAVNAITNPKAESLTRGDQQYNDPAHGVSGVLFTVDYFDRAPLGFRRHNSTVNSRYAVKPMYQKGTHDSLPYCPVIYLGLSRLLPFGEYKNDDAISGIKKNLPESYQAELAEIYKRFTHYSISPGVPQWMGDIKTRAEFASDYEGIDSNTISAGEDNLYIILTALMSLKYYFNSISSTRQVESVLLIDELDATLHPAFQIKLLHLFREFSQQFKIQIVFSTHSISLLESMLACKDNVIYLIDNISSVAMMDEPDIYKIKMHLSSLTHEDIYRDKVVPIFTEDAEARFLLNLLLSHFEAIHTEEFGTVKRFFHLVDVNLSAESLTDIFKDSKLLRMTMKSICVLDGDHNSDLSNFITTLPGRYGGMEGSSLSPEQLMCRYAEELFQNDDPFWLDSTIVGKGYTKTFYIDKIQSVINEYQGQVASGNTSKKPREFYKGLFNQHLLFFELLFKHWMYNPKNNTILNQFYSELRTLFKKVAPYNEINSNEWK